jgi:hypothetical protein
MQTGLSGWVFTKAMKRWARIRLVGAAMLLALCTAPAFAQGCAMCRANAKATPKEGQRAIDKAILLMIIPPIGAVTVGTGLIVRYARRRDREKDNEY